MGGLENPPKHAYVMFEWSIMMIIHDHNHGESFSCKFTFLIFPIAESTFFLSLKTRGLAWPSLFVHNGVEAILESSFEFREIKATEHESQNQKTRSSIYQDKTLS